MTSTAIANLPVVLGAALAYEGLHLSSERLHHELSGIGDLEGAVVRLQQSGLCEEYGFFVRVVSVADLAAHGDGDVGVVAALLVDMDGVLRHISLCRDGRGLVCELISDRGDSERVSLIEAYAPEVLALCLSVSPQRRWLDGVGFKSQKKYEWFTRHVVSQWREYSHVLVASAVLSVLAVLGTFFTMNVYDRVVPNNAFNTLWVLAIGVTFAYAFEFLFKELRGVMADSAGKRIDLAVSSALFGKVVGINLASRPASTGVMANHLREFEGVRDFFTSLSLLVLLDLPFLWLFLGVICLIGGWLVLIPLISIPIVLIFLYVIQGPMSKAVERASETGAQKHGLLIEALNALLDIKVLGAAPLLRRLWDHCSRHSAEESNKARFWSSLGVNFAAFIQQIVGVIMIVGGVYQIADGVLSMGGLIACTILNGRVMAPLGQMVSLAVRMQQTLQSLQTLSKIMDKPEDRVLGRRYISPANIAGEVAVDNVSYKYDAGQKQPTISEINLRIRQGERVAIIGKSGCGKSTLLKVVAGLLEPEDGSVSLAGRDVRQIDPVRLRRHMAYVPQHPLLMSGTIKENICLGMPQASDEQVLAAAHLAVLDDFIAKSPLGYDGQSGEGGGLLSGGQRQSLAIARGLISGADLIFMDEPTSAMDARTEADFKERFAQYAKGKTVVLITHKASMLDLVDRVIVMADGKIVSDTPRDYLRDVAQGQGSAITVVKQKGG